MADQNDPSKAKPTVPPTPQPTATPPPVVSAPQKPLATKPNSWLKQRRQQAAELGTWRWLLILILIVLSFGVIAANYRAGNALEFATLAYDTVKVVAHRVDSVEKIAVSAKAGAQQANARQSAQIKAENLQLKQMLAYVRLNNPAFGVCSKSEAEVEKLLTNGKWDIEGEIKVEYDRLISLGVASSAEAAKVTDLKINEVATTASQALDAGQAASKSVEKIADQPRKILGHSVSRPTARSIGEEIDAYKKKYNVKW